MMHRMRYVSMCDASCGEQRSDRCLHPCDCGLLGEVDISNTYMHMHGGQQSRRQVDGTEKVDTVLHCSDGD